MSPMEPTIEPTIEPTSIKVLSAPPDSSRDPDTASAADAPPVIADPSPAGDGAPAAEEGTSSGELTPAAGWAEVQAIRKRYADEIRQRDPGYPKSRALSYRLWSSQWVPFCRAAGDVESAVWAVRALLYGPDSWWRDTMRGSKLMAAFLRANKRPQFISAGMEWRDQQEGEPEPSSGVAFEGSEAIAEHVASCLPDLVRAMGEHEERYGDRWYQHWQRELSSRYADPRSVQMEIQRQQRGAAK